MEHNSSTNRTFNNQTTKIMEDRRNEIIGQIRVAIEDYKSLVHQYNIVIVDKCSAWTEDIHRCTQINKLKRKIKLLKNDIKMLHRELSEFDSSNKSI